LSASNHFPAIAYSKLMKPVKLLSGLAKLETKPARLGRAVRHHDRYSASLR
jgi:hypothetical protein